MRLIDADALKELIAANVYPVCDVFNSRDYGMFWTGGIEKAIDDAPTVDAVEVVRCKDCIYFHYDFLYIIQGVPFLMHEVCDFWGDGCKTSENAYYSHAERSE